MQSSDYEGTPNAVLEAMAYETPAIATDAGGTAELIADGVHGTIVPPGAVEPLRAAIDEALRDPEGARRRACAARRRVERELSFGARTAAIEVIYETLACRTARLRSVAAA